MRTLETLRANLRRDQTVHNREQARGDSDMSCAQTRRMALAVASLQRAAGELAREERSRRLFGRSGWPA